MRKELGEEPIRVTVRLPRTLYDDLVGPQRRYYSTGLGSISAVIRKALLHFLACPDLHRAEADASAVEEARAAATAQAVAAWLREYEAQEAAKEARRQTTGR